MADNLPDNGNIITTVLEQIKQQYNKPFDNSTKNSPQLIKEFLNINKISTQNAEQQLFHALYTRNLPLDMVQAIVLHLTILQLEQLNSIAQENIAIYNILQQSNLQKPQLATSQQQFIDNLQNANKLFSTIQQYNEGTHKTLATLNAASPKTTFQQLPADCKKQLLKLFDAIPAIFYEAELYQNELAIHELAHKSTQCIDRAGKYLLLGMLAWSYLTILLTMIIAGKFSRPTDAVIVISDMLSKKIMPSLGINNVTENKWSKQHKTISAFFTLVSALFAPCSALNLYVAGHFQRLKYRDMVRSKRKRNKKIIQRQYQAKQTQLTAKEKTNDQQKPSPQHPDSK